VLIGSRQCERGRRHDNRVGLVGDKRTLVKGHWIDDGEVDTGKNLEFAGDAEVMAAGGRPMGDNAPMHLLLADGLDHVVLDGLFLYPTIALNRHSATFQT
jgi:hypothetical protein